VPADLQSIADPRTILLVWAAGLALVAAAMSYARIVGAGFTWLTAGVAGLVGIPGVLAGGAWWARLGLLGVIVGAISARNRPVAGLALAVAGVGYLVEAACSPAGSRRSPGPWLWAGSPGR
jgi:hypothetical protein